jgi:hypothetical protein
MEGDSINLSMRKALALRQAWLRGSRQAHRAVALAFCQAQQVRKKCFFFEGPGGGQAKLI